MLVLKSDPILETMQKHCKKIGITSSISKQKFDFEEDYFDSSFVRAKDGIGNIGTLEFANSPIDYINILKKQKSVKCAYALGSHVGMGVHRHSWWKIRYFLTLPESIQLGPFNMGTITTIKKGLFHSKVESFVWSGFQKLTTLPPGLVRDNVADALYQDQKLRELMMKCLLKEGTITISRYSPTTESKYCKTNSKIVIESKWKYHKDFFIDYDTLVMYETIAEIVKQTINDMKYHLT